MGIGQMNMIAKMIKLWDILQDNEEIAGDLV
jgi:predicted RNA-binding protein